MQTRSRSAAPRARPEGRADALAATSRRPVKSLRDGGCWGGVGRARSSAGASGQARDAPLRVGVVGGNRRAGGGRRCRRSAGRLPVLGRVPCRLGVDLDGGPCVVAAAPVPTAVQLRAARARNASGDVPATTAGRPRAAAPGPCRRSSGTRFEVEATPVRAHLKDVPLGPSVRQRQLVDLEPGALAHRVSSVHRIERISTVSGHRLRRGTRCRR